MTNSGTIAEVMMPNSLIPFALIAATFAIVSATQLTIGWRGLISEIMALSPDDHARLPLFAREVLSSPIPTSWQSQLFQEVAYGDITWSAALPLNPTVKKIRRAFRLMICAFGANAAVLFATLLMTR
ncbi:MAG: hypothetical protein JNL39_10405 [Opitutaceae bacterium]|nr:hypothetical protein [Opitutaceae bacterium]